MYYLLNRNYPIKPASTFIGNHYLLSERQRLAIVRAVSSKENIEKRKAKEVKGSLKGKTVKIDGFNTIITLEIAFSNSLLIKCMDNTIRDLAALRSTYRLIDKTDLAILNILKYLDREEVEKVIFYLDAPVSNSGRLKQHILNLANDFNLLVEVEVINNVDSVLEKLDYVVTSDAIILDKCISFVNLTSDIISTEIKDCSFVNFVKDIEI